MSTKNNKLKELRVSKNFSQSELAEKIGVTQQQLSSYESGENFPRMPIALKLSEHLGVTINEIFLPNKTS